jgi:uncharacterized protein YjbJ (UPF0337 family)
MEVRHELGSDRRRLEAVHGQSEGEVGQADRQRPHDHRRDQLDGLLQQRYGYAKDQAEKELDEFSRALKP